MPDILSRLERKGENWARSDEYDLATAFAAGAPAGRLGWLMKWLSRLCWEDDKRSFGSSDSARWTPVGLYLLPALDAVVLRIIHERPDMHEDGLLIWNLDRLHGLRDYGLGPLDRNDDAADQGAVAEAVRTTPKIRRAIFLRAVQSSKKRYPHHAGYLLEEMSHHAHTGWSRLDPAADLDWMHTEYASATTNADLRAALVETPSRKLETLPWLERRKQSTRFVKIARHHGDKEAVKALLQWRFNWLRRHRWKAERFLSRPRWRRRARDLTARWSAVDLEARLIWHRKAVRMGNWATGAV